MFCAYLKKVMESDNKRVKLEGCSGEKRKCFMKQNRRFLEASGGNDLKLQTELNTSSEKSGGGGESGPGPFGNT